MSAPLWPVAAPALVLADGGRWLDEPDTRAEPNRYGSTHSVLVITGSVPSATTAPRIFTRRPAPTADLVDLEAERQRPTS